MSRQSRTSSLRPTRQSVEHALDLRASRDEFAGVLRIALMRVTRRLRYERSNTAVGLPELSVLTTLAAQGALTPRRIAELEGLRSSSLTRLLSLLERQDYLRRESHPEDGRQVIISITPEGCDLVLRERDIRNAWLVRVLELLGPEDERRLREALPALLRMSEAEEIDG